MHSERGLKLNYTTGIVVECFLTLIVVICTLFRFEQGVSLAFYMTFIVLAPMVVQYYGSQKIPIVLHLLIILTVANVFLDTLFSSQASITFSYFYKLVMFFCTMLFFCMASTMRIDRTTREFLLFLPVLMGVLAAASYFFFGNRAMIAHSITLGFKNSNFTGMWLIHFFFYTVLFSIAHKNVAMRVFAGGLILVFLYLIWKTYARSCFAGLFCFVFLFVFGLLKKEKKLNHWLIAAIVVSPILFAVIYLNVFDTQWFYNLIYLFIREGKSFNARDEIWRNAVSYILRNPVFGAYSELGKGSGSFQLHNTHLDVLASYGAGPFALFVALLYKISAAVNDQLNSFERYVAFISFLSIIVVGFFEAAIVAGSTGLYLLSGGFLILAMNGGVSDDESISGRRRLAV